MRGSFVFGYSVLFRLFHAMTNDEILHGRLIRILIPALGANAVFVQGDSAEGAALDRACNREFLGSSVHSAGESDLCDV